MKVAYITGQFPCISERFIAREISALARCGHDITVFSLKRPEGKACDETVVAYAHYRPNLLSWPSFCDPCGMILRSPIRCMRAFSNSLTNRPKGMGLLKVVRHFLTAISFARQARSIGVDRVHAHFAFVTADIAAAMVEMLGMSYTVSVHAWDLYAQTDDSIAKRVSRATKVVACTEHGRARVMRAVTGIEEDVVVIRHGLVPDQWCKGAEERGRTILGVGRLVAKKGFVVLAIDPPGQGERSLYFDPELGRSRVGIGTREHSLEEGKPECDPGTSEKSASVEMFGHGKGSIIRWNRVSFRELESWRGHRPLRSDHRLQVRELSGSRPGRI